MSIVEYWDAMPCNINHSNKPVGTLEYFEEVTKRKYFVEDHIPGFAQFEKYAGLRVLDVGCGIGTAMISFIKAGAIYTGIDISPKSIAIAKQRLEAYGLNANLLVGSIEDIFVDQDLTSALGTSFDLVWSFGVIHHLKNQTRAVSNIFKLLKPGGTFKLMLYAKNSWKYFKILDSLDQFEAQSGVPIADVYTNSEVELLLNAFEDIKIEQKHIFKYKIPEYKKYEYVVEEYFAAMSPELFNCLEKNLGFHLCITCNRPKRVDLSDITRDKLIEFSKIKDYVPDTRYMHLKSKMNQDLEQFINLINDNSNFVIVKFHDGELFNMTKDAEDEHNCDGNFYYKEQGLELINAYIFFLRFKNAYMTRWSSHIFNIQKTLDSLNEQYYDHSTKFIYNEAITHKLPFEPMLVKFYKAIKNSPRNKIYITNIDLINNAGPLLGATIGIAVPEKNSYLNKNEIIKTALETLVKKPQNNIILLSVGMYAKVLAYEIASIYPDNIIIDVGSSFDGLIKHSRDYNGTLEYRNKLLEAYNN